MPSTGPTRRRFLAAVAVLPIVAGIVYVGAEAVRRPEVDLVDDAATDGTRSLFAYLRRLMGTGLLFGHQHDLSHGFTFESPDGVASDTFEAVGDHPALFGWDTLILEGKERPGTAGAAPGDNESAFIRGLQDAHRLGGISTVSAHLPNFVNGTDFDDTSGRVVSRILPGGDRHIEFRAFLDGFARVCRGAVADDGELIPIIFRPWHENNGHWFWWGAEHTTVGEFVEIFRFTVEYLRDTCSVHNLLYAYSPGGTWHGDRVGYLRSYPGDRFVDVLGYDSYDGTAGRDEYLTALVTDLRMVVELADARGKIPAYTEFGEDNADSRNSAWFTTLLAAIRDDPTARRVTYMLTWANFGEDNQAYVPFPAHDGRAEHPLLPDFRRFAADPYTLLAGDTEDVFSLDTKAVENTPFLHLVTPTDRQRLSTTETVVRARVTGAVAVAVWFDVDGGEAVAMSLDDDGFWSAAWTLGSIGSHDGSASLTVTTVLDGRRHTDTAVVLLGEVVPLPHGWVDDFEGYAGDDVALSQAYSRVNSNRIALTTVHKASGNYGMAFAYDLDEAGYTGIGKVVDQDWSALTALRVWLRGDGSTNSVALQIVADGGYFEHRFGLERSTGAVMVVPFEDFAPAPWDSIPAESTLDDARLAKVSRFNMNIEYGGVQARGTVYVDDIRAE